MRAGIFSAAILSLASCVSRIDVAAWKKESESQRVDLMRTESEVCGDFFRLRTFHTDLMQMPGDTSRRPYPTLEAIFRECMVQANAVALQRMLFDTTCFALEQACAGKKKVKKEGQIAGQFARYTANSHELPAAQGAYRVQYFLLRKNYNDSCLHYGVKRLGPEEYAALISLGIVQWQDSLEEAGRLSAKARADLKSRFDNQRGPEYFAAYRPLSELEAAMKQFDSVLSQLQNSLSRFEEGNREDYLYFGPHLRVRMEVQATEDLFVQCSIIMQQCRMYEQLYYRQYESEKKP